MERLVALTQDGTRKSVKTKDWNIVYYEAGEGHPLILLHGSGAGASGWSNFSGNIDELSQHFRVLAVDMPGWGESDPCTIDQLDHVEALKQFMDALGIEKAALVGNSMGGMTVLRMSTTHPERVSHAITMGSGSVKTPKLFSAGDGPTEGLKILIEGYRNPSPDTIRKLVEIMCFDKGFATDELCQKRSDAAKAKPEHLKNYLDGIPKGGPVPVTVKLEDLNTSTIPFLLIHGRDDRVVPYEHSLLLLANIPNSRLVLLNRCGHWAMIEHAKEFNRLVIDFVENAS